MKKIIFNNQYTTNYRDSFGNKIILEKLNGVNYGSMITKIINYPMVACNYYLKEQDGDLYFLFHKENGKEYLITTIRNGLKLISQSDEDVKIWEFDITS